MQLKLTGTLDSQFTNNQHGFRKYRSCVTAWTCFKQKLTLAMDTKDMLVGAIFIDFKKAFDYVPPQSVLQSLYVDFDVDASLIKLLASFMLDRNFYIFTDNYLSEPFPYNSTCPQGSTLASTLFIVFINLLSQLSADTNIEHLLFADDLFNS